MSGLTVILIAIIVLNAYLCVKSLWPKYKSAKKSVSRQNQAVVSEHGDLIEWERGFKTDRVIATRYKTRAGYSVGYSLGFDFPLNPNDADRLEVSEFFQAHQGNCYQSGGYPGSTSYVIFADVDDDESANKKMMDILPDLSNLIIDLGNGVPVKIDLPKPAYKWPDTSPPAELDNPSYSVNGRQYKKQEVEPGKWQWVLDEEAMRQLYDEQMYRRNLYQALRTRRLSDDEMKQALAYGDMLNVELNVSYRASDKAIELNDAWFTQNRIRMLDVKD